MEIVLVVVLLVVGIALYFVFGKKKGPGAPEFDAADEPQRLPEKPAVKQALPAKSPDATAAPAAKAAPAQAPTPKATPKSTPEAKPAPKVEPPAAKAEPLAPKAEAAAADERPAAPAEAPKVAEAPAPTPAPPPAATAPVARPKEAPASTRKLDVAGLRRGLGKVRETEGFFGRLKALFVRKKEIDPALVEEIEEVLLTSDVGAKTTQQLLQRLREGIDSKELDDGDRVWEALRTEAKRLLAIGGGPIPLVASPTVVMVVGVNGAGKTTTIGKLATRYKAEGKSVVLAAGDTFRAAAVQQLSVWAKRVGCEIVHGKDGASPGAVIFDAIQRAKEIGADVVLADTAGRLHTKTNLMDELKKVERTMAKAMDGAPHETLLVLDATNGQNAVQQATLFKETLRISGLVLTKLDGTAKGGVVLGISSEHELPVRYVGIGERPEDLRDFDADELVEAMLGQGDADDAS